MTLEQVLADAREQANTLRLHGHTAQADSISRVCDEVAAAAEPWLTWLSEPEAALRSGRSLVWWRRRFPTLERDGLARQRGRHREYREVAVASDANVVTARHQGRQAARQASA